MAKLTRLKAFRVKPLGVERISTAPVQARVIRRGGLIANNGFKSTLNKPV